MTGRNRGQAECYLKPGGKRIAKIPGADTRLRTSAVETPAGNVVGWFINDYYSQPRNADGTNYSVSAGDQLCFRQYNTAGAVGGPNIFFSNGRVTAWQWSDQQGVVLNMMATSGSWVNRCTDVSMGGTTLGTNITGIGAMSDPPTSANSWSIYYADMSLVTAAGAVIPINLAVSYYTGFQGSGTVQAANALETVPSSTDPTNGVQAAATHFFMGDHLGTAQLELSSGGWPVWQGQFAPFGQEIQGGAFLDPTAPDGSSSHYKFTGKERDTESGLDYFGARYYASNMGRWMSPDWSASPEAVPYADLANPQSLNLYGYVGNNPLSKADPDGHCTNGGQQKGFWWCAFNDSDQDADRARANLAAYKNILINGQAPSDAAKGLSNTQTVNLDRSVLNYISSQVMSSPGMMIGLAIVPGGAEEVVGREIGEIDVAGVGLGITGKIAAETVSERLAIEAAQSAPASGKVLQTVLNDSRWPASQGWVKMESRSAGGVVVHWVRNTITGAATDFKLIK